MLDTCVLVDFSLIYAKEDKKQPLPERLKKCKELLEKLEGAKFQNVMSSLGKWELRKVIMEIKLEQKFVESGYTPREFGEAKREISLDEKEIDLVNEAVFGFWKFSERKMLQINKEESEKIECLTKKGFGFMDCLLVSEANKYECGFFVTRDNRMIALNEIQKDLETKIIGVTKFLSELKEKNKV